MKIHSALITYHRTMFSSPAWRCIPWTTRPKTWRDTLMDIALDMTESVGFDVLEGRLTSWHQRWLKQHRPKRFVCSRGGHKYCFCSLPPASIPNNEFALLQGEFYALALLPLVQRRNALLTDARYCKKPLTFGFEELEGTCQRISTDLASVLTLPCFGQETADGIKSRGISEGRSRSLLCSSALDLMQEPFSDDLWWSKVAGRLNGPIS